MRDLERQLHQPLTVRELGIDQAAFEQALPELVARAETDTQIATSPRIPDSANCAGSLNMLTPAGQSIFSHALPLSELTLNTRR